MPKEFATEILSLKTSLSTLVLTFSSFVTSVVLNNSLRVNLMYHIFVPAITEHLSSFLEIQITTLTLTFGQLAVLSRNSCSVSLFSRERVALINLLKSLKFWEPQVKRKFLQWIPITMNIVSLRFDLSLGIKYSVTEPQKKRSILSQLFSYTTHSKDPPLLVPSLTPSLMNYVTKTPSCPTVSLYPLYSTLLQRNSSKNPTSSSRSSPIGTRA
jgi:hypothetical protein